VTRDDHVLVLGGTGVDTIVHVPELPLPFADSYPVPAIQARAGQTGDGVAIGLRALGFRVSLIDTIGDDPEGNLVRALHARYGVVFTGIHTTAGTKRAVNLVDPNGRRLSLYDISRHHESDRLPADLVTDVAHKAGHVHVSITHPCQHALPALLDAGVSISTDLHNWDGVNPWHEPFAYRSDIVFVSTTALIDVEATMRQIITNGRAHSVIATAGADGAYLLERKSHGVRQFPAAQPSAPAVDSNGAGDAFAAAFLFGHLHGESVETQMRYGAIAGAHACTIPSAETNPIDTGGLQLAARYRSR
jgi:sugar/nucleoside kinase (ribokinase family)